MKAGVAMLDMVDIMRRLSGDRPVFHSEANFQHALAWRIHEEAAPSGGVRLEYKPFAMQTKRVLDIWVPDIGVAIELKYTTRKLNMEWRSEHFALRDQSAQDQRRYDFISDISRLEDVVRNGRSAVGYAILLTNDPSYWNYPRKPDNVDADFHLYEGRRIKGKMEWSPRASAGTKNSRETP